jgi:tRNA(adenine34) deaminase
MDDASYMDMALRESEEALVRGDRPVGAVVVKDGVVLCSGQNRYASSGDVLLHAETDAIRRGTQLHGAGALVGATVYCTMEPCPMCAWAMHLAGIRRVVLGLRHATLGRTDMGSYSVESFGAMTGVSYERTTGVREAECLAQRQRWGKDQLTR